MVENLWSDDEALGFVTRYAELGADIALRLYTSQLIGRDPGLVLHGGGNTSVKTTARDALGDELEVLAVKASGYDLATLGAEGLPLLELAPLRRLLQLDALGDGALLDEVRRRRLDGSAPDPTVEVLLHAALPPRYVDHTHADAILVLADQPDGARLVREALGDRVAVLGWVKPGFPLAKAVAAAFAADPEVEGLVLLHHGLFTWGDDARTSYGRMVELVSRAQEYVEARAPATAAGDAADAARAAEVLPVVRGAVSRLGDTVRHLVCSWRRAPDLVAFSRRPDCRALAAAGPLTPDHVIRTKARYLYLDAGQARSPEACRQAVDDFAADYRETFAAHRDRLAEPPVMHDPLPRVAVVEGLGVLAFGTTPRAAAIAGDIAEHTLRGKAQAAALGTFQGLPAGELFDMEYWPLELSKLGTRAPRELDGRVAVVTGGAGAIGFGICEALADAGAAVVVADLTAAIAQGAVDKLAASRPDAALQAVAMDVTDADSVSAAFRKVVEEFGGVDIVVPNAGIAHVSTLRDMTVAAFQRVLAVNLTGTMTVLSAAARVLEAQGLGGAVIVQASKNVFAPGASFGAYSASKAGQHQLGKVAALELAPHKVRVNMINADAVFGEEVRSGLWEEVGPDRMRSRGLDEQGLKEYYRDRSLLKISVTPRHVGDAVVFLASDRSAATTGVTITVDGGVAAAFPR